MIFMIVICMVAVQDKNDIYSSLYTIKWFMQCFLDRVSILCCALSSKQKIMTKNFKEFQSDSKLNHTSTGCIALFRVLINP